jgi:hypothetical protein
MEVGDLVRLKQSFKPVPDGLREYRFGVVAGLVFNKTLAGKHQQLAEVVLHLYEPETSSPYLDEFGVQVLYSFYPNEVEPL